MPLSVNARADSVGTPPLEARPKAETRSIEDLVDDARKGRLRIPPFQRALKWQPDDARLLLDSVYRGYPIGTLLFWQTKAEAAQVHFGPTVTIDAGARNDAWWVVDGQQRLNSLVRVLVGSGEDEFRLWFDLDSEEFVRESRTRSDSSRFLPLTEVLDSERLHQWVSEEGLSADRKRIAFRINKRIREYAVPAYIVETENQEVLRRIFERANNSGKALSPADVFDALYGARGHEDPTDFEAVAAALVDLGFGELEENILYGALLAIHDLDAVGGKVPTSFSNAPQAYKRTALALRSAVVFVMGTVGIGHANLLPYKQPLVALAKFFDRFPQPSARSRELLRRWIWRGAWSGVHRGDTVSTRAILGAIGEDENDTLQRLLATVGKTEPEERGPVPYNFRNARSKLDVLGLLSLGPRHLVTGAPLPPSSISGPESIAVIASGEGTGTVAGRLIHPPLPKLRSALVRADAALRATHAVSDRAHAALLDGDLEAFLKEREASVKTVVQSFLRLRAKWGDNDRPPLDALLVSDEV